MIRTRWFRWGDAIPIAITLVAALLLCAGWLWAPSGETVRVTTPTEEFCLPLDGDAEKVLEGQDGQTLTVRVENGRACVLRADCPDQVCVNTGWLSKNGQTAACLPAGILLTVESADASSPDAVAR